MLITGDIDNNVHPANTYRLADALIKANKRFDMFVLPGVRHSFQPVSGYVNWLRGDYFARHLLGTSVRQRRHRRTESGEGADRRQEEIRLEHGSRKPRDVPLSFAIVRGLRAAGRDGQCATDLLHLDCAERSEESD